MRSRPDDVSDGAIAEALCAGWAIEASSVRYEPVGFGSHHWGVESDQGRWFVSVDHLTSQRQEVDEPMAIAEERLLAALSTATALAGAGLDFVIAPVRTSIGDVARRLGDDYVIAVYPHVDGESRGFGSYGSPEDRLAVLERLVEVHGAPVACRSTAGVDDLTISHRRGLDRALGEISRPWDSGPFGERSRELLAVHAGPVREVFERYDELADRIRTRPERMTLTHGEPHPGNTMLTDRGLVLIDWDTALIAPPERDLWSLVAEDPSVVAWYEERTGTPVDPDALELYRLAWDLTEVAIYVSDFFAPHELTDDTSTGWENLRRYLDPDRW